MHLSVDSSFCYIIAAVCFTFLSIARKTYQKCRHLIVPIKFVRLYTYDRSHNEKQLLNILAKTALCNNNANCERVALLTYDSCVSHAMI